MIKYYINELCLENKNVFNIVFILGLSYTSVNNNWYQYTMKQIDGRYYVGITNNKLNQHFYGTGIKYQPIDVQEENYKISKIKETIKTNNKNMYDSANIKDSSYTLSIEK